MNFPVPKPKDALIFRKSLVKTIYSFSKKPDPAKSSNPIATFGRFLFLKV